MASPAMKDHHQMTRVRPSKESASMKQPVLIDPRHHDAVIFDLDGVVTDTASIHAKAWTSMFDDFLAKRPARDGENHSRFTSDDYRHFVDGKPRDAGVTDFLASRGISLDRGSPADDATAETVCGLGNRKQEKFRRLLADGIGDLFPLRLDGIVAAELGLPGKPDPAVALETARRLHVRPDRCVRVEDAEAGVAAGRNGGFGFVIGIDRTGHRAALVEQGADAVVTDLAEVAVRD
jgi:alpha,alpha-trehalase